MLFAALQYESCTSHIFLYSHINVIFWFKSIPVISLYIRNLLWITLDYSYKLTISVLTVLAGFLDYSISDEICNQSHRSSSYSHELKKFLGRDNRIGIRNIFPRRDDRRNPETAKRGDALPRFILPRIDFRTQMARRQFPRERSSAGAQNFRSWIYPTEMTIRAAESDLSAKRSRNCCRTSQLWSNSSFVRSSYLSFFFNWF